LTVLFTHIQREATEHTTSTTQPHISAHRFPAISAIISTQPTTNPQSPNPQSTQPPTNINRTPNAPTQGAAFDTGIHAGMARVASRYAPPPAPTPAGRPLLHQSGGPDYQSGAGVMEQHEHGGGRDGAA